MKVCILTTVHSPFDPRIFHRQAKTLAQAGYSISLITQRERSQEADGIRVLSLRPPRNRLQRVLFLPWKEFRLARKLRAHIYHLHDPELIPVGLALKLFTRGRVIYDAHEDYPPHMLCKMWLPRPMRRIASRLMFILERTAARRLDAVIVPTMPLEEKFRNMQARKVLTVQNLPLVLRSEAKGSFSDEPCEFDVLHVGTLSRERLAFLLDIAEAVSDRIPGSRWCFLGVDRKLSSWGEREARQRGILSTVKFVEQVPYDQVSGYIRRSRIGVNYHPDEPRFRVALPMKVLEYMAEGIPTVSSSMPVLDELVGSTGAVLLVPPEDKEAFANAVLRVLRDVDLARRMGDCGAYATRSVLNWESEARKLVNLYKTLLEECT